MARLAMTAVLSVLLTSLSSARSPSDRPSVDMGSLLEEMYALDALARMPAEGEGYDTVQFSSYDRRSTSPEEPFWYSNADGFGREPIPGFSKVLEEPGEDGVGLYLMADVQGPGAVVRGWSAGMGGILRVFLDGADQPVFEGTGYDFLAKRSEIFLARAGLSLECGDAFRQQDSDYFPIPFARSLKITWQGPLNSIHFYHLEVRRYRAERKVKTFSPEDLPSLEKDLEKAVLRLTRPESGYGLLPGEEGDLEPGAQWEWTSPGEEGPGALAELRIRVMANDRASALRGTLLRIFFDGASRPQVEAPVGDFFGTGPGINPYDSLPCSVAGDGTMTCRFVMPFQRKARVVFQNTTSKRVRIRLAAALRPWSWEGGDRSLHFHAKWRTDNQVDLSSGPFDMPYIVVRGQGRFVGAAVMVVNPSTIPTPGGNWWGEGDEKIFVDDGPFPAFFGTGSEDYFNYSWSRPDLFDHPYCGQPLDTGPGCLGYVSNHRWHILDGLLFERSLSFYMELWHHMAYPGLCYSRIAYYYARPGAIDDHRRVQHSELVVPALISMEPQPLGGATNATILHVEDLDFEAKAGTVALDHTQPGASRERLIAWRAGSKDRLRISFPVKEGGEYSLNLVAAHWPESGSLRLLLNGKPLVVENLGGAGMGRAGEEVLVLRSPHARRLLSTRCKKLLLEAGDQELILECVEAGRFGFDYLWVKKLR